MDTRALDGKVAVVTGGASGIGLAIARLLAARGARVAVTDVRDAALNAASAELGHGGMLIHADNTSVGTILAARDRILKEAGRIDILVNNAGVSGMSKLLQDIDEASFDVMFATHVRGAFFWAQAVVGAMRAQGGGRIVNISSNFAMTGNDCMSHYVGAKGALLGFTKAWARELAADQITVNAVAPGLVATPMTRMSVGDAALQERAADVPLGRLARTEEIAFAVAWLASAEAAMMTGQVVSPNGGIAIVGI